MSQRFEDLVIQAFKDLKEDVKSLDSKMDDSTKIHIKNTAVLEEHERRSTASEGRLALLEVKQAEIEKKANRIQGFFIYSGIVLGALGTLVALFHDFLEAVLKLK